MVHGIKHYALFTSHAPWVQLVELGGSLQADKRLQEITYSIKSSIVIYI
jgi:hypothetical protein